jgi:hypothetical protein
MKDEVKRYLELKIDWRKYYDAPHSNQISMFDLFKEVNICLWWKEHQTQFPVLSTLARIHLAMPAAQSFQERVFSTAKHTLGQKRTRLDQTRFKQATILRHNKKLMASRKQELEDSLRITV